MVVGGTVHGGGQVTATVGTLRAAGSGAGIPLPLQGAAGLYPETPLAGDLAARPAPEREGFLVTFVFWPIFQVHPEGSRSITM